MFTLTVEEAESLRCQNEPQTSVAAVDAQRLMHSLKGVAMLSSVLRSDRAAEVNAAIIRTFLKLREILATHKDLARKVEEHDQQIAVLFDSLWKRLASPGAPEKHPIGYIHPKD